MPNNLTTEQIVRRFLNPAIKGRFADALVAAIAAGDDPNALNVLAAKDQLMIATATGQYLDVLFGRLGVIRPPQTGIDDDTFRDLGVAITNNKLVSNVFLQILEAFYGQEAVSANMLSVNAEPYNLADGMQLVVRQDSRPTPLVITFHTSDFQNINAATAQEVSDSISRQSFDQGYTLTASPSTNTITSQTYVQLFTGTLGPKGAITVLGGQAQNILSFPTIDPTTQSIGTQLTLSISGGNIRFTWTGGPDPGFGAVEVGDYANVFGAGFSPSNRGTFTIEVVQSGTVGNSYFEVQNPNFVPQAPVTLAAVSDILFFHPSRITINSFVRKASVYEINPYEIVVLLPVTTKIIKRQLIGSAHLNPSVPGLFLGSYIYDTKSGFKISSVRSKLNTGVQEGQVYTILDIGNTKGFPANGGFLVFDYGYATQEGPVKYLAVASGSTLLMDPAYKFKQDHSTNSVVNLVSSTAPFVPATDGSDYQFYVTDSVNGRVQAEKLIDQLTAAGITVTVIIVYPNGPGLVSVQDAYSDAEVV